MWRWICGRNGNKFVGINAHEEFSVKGHHLFCHPIMERSVKGHHPFCHPLIGPPVKGKPLFCHPLMEPSVKGHPLMEPSVKVTLYFLTL